MTPPGLGRSVRKLMCTAGVHHVGRARHGKKLLIVMYHGVTHNPAVARRWWHHVLAADFERQLRYLKSHYDVRPIDEALGQLWSGGLERPTACVTFDDGYRNNNTVAFPIMEKLQIPATIYLATGMIGTKRRLWTVELDHAFTATKVTHIDLTMLGLGKRSLHGDDHRTLFKQVLNGVKEIPFEDRPGVLDAIFSQLKAPDDPATHEPFVMMDWEDVAKLSETGLMTFGGHTVNHEIVSRLGDTRVHSEITESVEAVARHGAAMSKTFAYPNGAREDFDLRAIEAVRSVGCNGAVTTIEGLSDRNTNHFELKRIGVGSDTSFDQFRLLTSGVISDIKSLSNPTSDAGCSTRFRTIRDTPD